MPESCPPLSKCGTVAPVWMNGSHVMNVGDMVDYTACINMGQCCDDSIAIKVKKCSSHFVYYLGPTPGCPIAYCAGSRAPCPAGQSSSDGFPPCEEVYPVMTTGPTFEGPIVGDKYFKFTCSVNYNSGLPDPDLRFEVEWTFDGQPLATIPSVELTDPSTVVVLDGGLLQGKLDTLIRCRVRAWYSNRTVEVKGPWRVSDKSYYAGFRLDPAKLDVTHQTAEQKVVKVKVVSTVPIVCSLTYNSTQTCCIYIHLDVDGQKGVLVASSCKYKMCSNNWVAAKEEASIEINIKATNIQIVPAGSGPLFLSFEKIQPKILGGPYLDAFKGHSLPEIPVTVLQGSRHKCYWTGDPHLTGYHGNYFHMYKPGDFTMYKHEHDNFELQSRNYVCNGLVACQCALLIKEQEDIIHINNCGFVGHAPVIEATRNLRKGTYIDRTNDGKTIVVYLPSGREVKVVTGKYQNTYFTVPANDGGTGICGTPNGASYPKRDGTNFGNPCAGKGTGCVPEVFTEHWRVPSHENLFNKPPPSKTSSDSDAQYCQCDTTSGDPEITCPLPQPPNNPLNGQGTAVNTQNLPVFTVDAHRKKKSTDYVDSDIPEPAYIPTNTTSGNYENLNWPTSSGMTEAVAQQLCESAVFGSPVYTHCTSSSDLLNRTLASCVLDILYTDGTDMVESSVDAFTDNCLFDLMQNVSNYVTDSDGNLVLKESLAKVCASNCQSHGGSCVNGQCQCPPGKTGSSCQLTEGQPPSLHGIRGSSVCDVNERPCRTIFMNGEGFEDGDHFLCRVREIDLSGTVNTSSAVTERAQFITDARLACPLPDARVTTEYSVKSFEVSVTFDGMKFSNPLIVKVFDSSCLHCDAHTCLWKPGTCHISNRCYKDGDVNPTDQSEVCDPSASASEWTPITLDNTSPALHAISALSAVFAFLSAIISHFLTE